MLLSPCRAIPLGHIRPPLRRADFPLNVFILAHGPVLVKNCRILRLFLPPFRAAPAHFYACSSVCRELLVEFVRFSKNAIFRTFIGEKFEKRACNSSKKVVCCIQQRHYVGYMSFYERFFAQHKAFVLKIAIFFIYLLIIYPACPARGKKSDDSTCTSHRFFFLSVLSQA